jgi:predicted metalloprotease
MEWEGQEESSNVEDRRQFPVKAAAIGGGGLIIVLVAMFLGVNPQKLLDMFGQGQGQPAAQQGEQGERKADPAEERLASFTKVVLRDTEVVWGKLFRETGKQYRVPKLVLFTGRVDSACGMADSAVGPFYCPGDSNVYIDLSFYKDMERKLNAPGEFARAYVIAHEVGHHVQRLLGYSARADADRSESKNQRSVRLELQADYLAGVWAHYSKEKFKLNEEDIDSALNAAFEIGDDRLQRKARGTVVPDSFTHGTSKQRQRWFREGFETGDVSGARQLFEMPYNRL